ncbi:retrovirus-related pol polyprotein from transposon TNT 1-94 [Tanacetum coccineum]
MGKSKDTPCVSNTLDPLSQKLENKNVELEFQIKNYAKENAHLKTAYKNLFDSINVSRAQSKGITDSLQNKLNDMIYENMKLRAKLIDKVSEKKDTTKGASVNTQFCKIHPFKTSREDKFVPINKFRASVRTNPITVPQPHVISKKDVNSDSNGLSSTRVDITTKTMRPQPKSNTKNNRVPFASKSRCIKNKEVEVEEHHRNLLLSKNKKPMSSECNNVNLAIRNDKSEVVCAMYLEVAFRRNTCFVRNLEGVDLLKGNRTTNLYTINLYEMASASPIFLMACATSTKSWLWHQRLSHLNFDTIYDLAKNDLVTGLPKFKYHKEHLCPSCEQGKSKKASHPPKPVPSSKQRLHLLHMDLCGPMRVESINGKRYVLVIIDDYSHYTWVLFLRSKDEAPEEIKTFLKKITVLLQAPVIMVRTDNDTEFKCNNSHFHILLR